MKLWQKVALGLVLGIAFGFVAKDKAVLVKPIGDIFIGLIKLVVLPLIYFSLIAGITGMSDPSSLGRIGMKASIAFIATTIVAILIGLGMAILLKPGAGLEIDFDENTVDVAKSSFKILDLFMDVIPDNAVACFANNKTLQVVFFGIFTGVALNAINRESSEIGRQLIDLFHLISKLWFKMIGMVVNLSPYGAFALTAWVVGEHGIEIIKSLAKLVMSVVIAMGIQYLIFGVLIFLFARLSPMPFYKKSFEYQLLAFSTSSSKATLATTMKICSEKLGVSSNSTSFILPLGASINMVGTAIYLGMFTVFLAQVTGATLHLQDYFIIIITATLGSIGAAGMPGGSIFILPMILSSVNLPVEGVALIAGIDRILDMLRTVVNITGDAAVTLIIDKTEKNLDEKIYNSPCD